MLDAAGQTGYKSGYVLTHDRDTLRGLIQYDKKTRTSKPCFYKSNSEGPTVDYVPGAISGFNYDDGQYFVSRSIGNSADVFLEVLATGHVSLYKFHTIYFIEKTDSAFFELSDEVDLVVVEGERIRRKSRNHTRMLALLMADCKEASKKIASVKLKEKPLVKLVTTYNTCKGSPTIYYRIKFSP